MIIRIILVVTLLLCYSAVYAVGNDSVEVEEYVEGASITFKWKQPDGMVRRGTWKRQPRDVWYRKQTPDCGLPGFCEKSDLRISSFNDGCIYVAELGNSYSTFFDVKPYRLAVDAACDAYEQRYIKEDVSSHFEFSSNRVSINSERFSYDAWSNKTSFDASLDGSKLVVADIKDAKQVHNSVYVFDFIKKSANKITFPRFQNAYVGFVDHEEFVVVFRDISGLRNPPKEYVGYFNANIGFVFRFDNELNGNAVKVRHKYDRGVCQFDELKTFNVSSYGVKLSAGSPGACGFVGYYGEAKWHDGELEITRLEGLGQSTFQSENYVEKLPLHYFGRKRFCNKCVYNEGFYLASYIEGEFVVDKVEYNGVPINAHTPDTSYLFPVWKKDYSGFNDVSAIMDAYVDNGTLNIEIKVNDDVLVFDSDNAINTDHIEFWLFSHPTAPLNSEHTHYEGWVGQVHYQLGRDSMTLMDEVKYKSVSANVDYLKKFPKNVKVSFEEKENGYRQNIAILLDQLPYYSFSNDGRQCVSVMVDVVDVDDSGKQESLLSNNIARKWGRRAFAPSVCFDHKQSISLGSIANNKGLAAPDNSYAILINNGSVVEPKYFTKDSNRLKDFQKLKTVNYQKSKLQDLSEDQAKKIVHGEGTHRGGIGPCPLQRVSFNEKFGLVFLVSDCGRGGHDAHLSVYSLEQKKLIVSGVAFYHHCYRHCSDDGYDPGKMEYGVLDDKLHVVQIANEVIAFSLDDATLAKVPNSGFPKLADDITQALKGNSLRRDTSSNFRYPVFYQTGEIWINERQLDMKPIVYRSPLIKYASYSLADVSCLEALAIYDFVDSGVFELPEAIPESCLSEHFDRSQLTHKVVDAVPSIGSVHVYDEVIRPEYNERLGANTVAAIASNTESLEVSLDSPDDVAQLRVLNKFSQLKKLRLRLGNVVDLNKYLDGLSLLSIEYLDFQSSYYDHKGLAFSFSDSLIEMNIRSVKYLADDVIYKNVKRVSTLDVLDDELSQKFSKIFPNLEELSVLQMSSKLSSVPKNLRSLSIHSGAGLTADDAFTFLSGLDFLTIGGANIGHIIPALSELDVGKVKLSGHKYLVGFETVSSALEGYVEPEEMEARLKSIAEICNGMRFDQSVMFPPKKIAIGAGCVSQALRRTF